jgi:ABC-2 type transport system ATP-binding protein
VSDGPAVATDGLRKRYGRVEALAGLSMTVGRGEVFGFLGPNGAGKTTTVKLLLGLARPSGGGGSVLGAPLGDLATRRRVGYLPELFRFQPWLMAHEVLELHGRLIGLPRRERRPAADTALARVGLAERATAQVGTFSKGMQQRLGLAVALLGRPELVLLDEPTSALDPLGRIDVRAIVRDAADRGAAVFLNSHLLTEVERVCDRVAIVDRGRVVAEGSLDELLGERRLRIRVTDLPADAALRLASFGGVRIAGDELVIAPIEPERTPDVVATLVALGGRVHEVESARGSLEERFLALVGRAAATPAPPAGSERA